MDKAKRGCIESGGVGVGGVGESSGRKMETTVLEQQF